MIELGANVNHAYKDGKTALMIAVERRQVKEMQELIKGGANVNHANKDGDTPLMWASRNGNQKSIKELIEGGANFNIQNKKGKTALIYGLEKDHSAVIKAFIESCGDRYGWNDLMQNAYDGNKKAIKELADGKTALMWAAGKGKLLPFMQGYAKIKFNLPNDIVKTISCFIGKINEYIDIDNSVNWMQK